MIVADPVDCSRAITSEVARLLAEHPEWHCIATFFPLAGEPDLRLLSGSFPDRGFVYPRMEGSDMTFHRVTDPTAELTPTRWNLREPLAELPLVTHEEINVMLCPGMAFDTKGRRLGKGRGFYDRYLADSHPGRPFLIGVTFSTYLFCQIPHESHDVTMDLVVTEKGAIMPK